MWKALIILVLVLIGLIYWDRSLSETELLSRHTSLKVRQLIAKELRESQRIAAIRLEDPGQKETFIYARGKDAWRCLSRFGAVADEAKIKSLLEKLFNTQGIVQSKDPARAPDYGLGPASVLHLSLHGPKFSPGKEEDLLHSFDVGAPNPGGNGCYVRLSGGTEVVAIDANLREELARPELQGIPPLVDPHIIPPVGLGTGGVQRIVVDRSDGERYELNRREKKISPEEMKQGQLPWDWFLKKSEKEEICPPGPSNAYANFLLRAPFQVILDPKTLPQLGLEKPSARLSLYSSEGKPVVIAIGSRGANARAPVWNELTQNVFEVSKEVDELLAPRSEQLLHVEQGSPWEAWLRR